MSIGDDDSGEDGVSLSLSLGSLAQKSREMVCVHVLSSTLSSALCSTYVENFLAHATKSGNSIVKFTSAAAARCEKTNYSPIHCIFGFDICLC